jgi:hypothetical protein
MLMKTLLLQMKPMIRTYLQPQLNKACKQSEKRLNGDVNPKDFILFPKDTFRVVSTWKDNTGNKQYESNITK